jgi:rod shape determining protein RodA
VVVPFLLIIKQNDTGSALVYASFLLVFYREGMPGEFLLIGTSLIILFISVLLSSLLYVEIGVLIFVLLIFFIIQRDLRTLLIATSIITLLIALVWAASYFTKLNWALENIIAICSIVSILAFWIWAFRRRLRYIYFLLFFAFSAISFSYSVNYFFQNMLGTHQQNRINVLLGIETDPRGIGYNVHQSKVAIGSGGLSGKGFLEGTQNKGSFVPEQSTDFIFCTIGEEWGFIGSTFVLLVFGAFIARTIQLAERQRSTFSRVYGYSVASIIFFHLFVNIGMTIGLMPVIGIPLPFFSYGGSSLIAFTILVFIFIRLDTSRDEIL